VDMSNALLPEVVPEVDANPVSFYSRGGGVGITIRPTWGLGRLQNTENAANLLLPLGTKSSAPTPPYKLALHVLAMHVHPTFLTWRRPWERIPD